MGRRTIPHLSAAALAASLLVAGACSGDDEGDAAEFCQRLERLTENDPFAAFGDTATEAEMEDAMTALRDRAEELVEVAPEEARGAATDYRDAVVAVDDLLADAGYGPTSVDVDEYRDQSQAYAEAAVRLERYLTAEC